MRVLVLAHGDGRRWTEGPAGPFLGHPKHLIQVDGVTLIARVAAQFTGRGATVTVVAPDDDRYRLPGTDLAHLEEINGCGSDMGKLLDTRHLWATDGRTVIVWGDCWYSDTLVDDIVDSDHSDYHVWRRPGRSTVTGARWDESFAISFGPGDHTNVAAAAELVAGLVRDGSLKASHIRTHLAAMAGHTDPAQLDDLEVAASCGLQTHVDDWSDDFDTPREWREWMRRRFDHDGHKVGVCIPWCGGDEWRTTSFQWALAWWQSIPGVQVYVGDDPTGGDHPNRAAMRNTAARSALADGCDVLFFADSDTFVSRDQLWAAVHLALHQRRLVLAFDRYLRVTRPMTVRMMRRGLTVNKVTAHHLIRRAYRSNRHISGALAIPAALFDTIGGYDERFTRWGYEDRAFWLAGCTIGGVAQRVPGDAFHWWHPPAVDKDRHAPDSVAPARLARRYYIAAGWVPDAGAVRQAIEQGLIEPIELAEDATADPDLMRAILTEPGGPLARILQEV